MDICRSACFWDDTQSPCVSWNGIIQGLHEQIDLSVSIPQIQASIGLHYPFFQNQKDWVKHTPDMLFTATNAHNIMHRDALTVVVYPNPMKDQMLIDFNLWNPPKDWIDLFDPGGWGCSILSHQLGCIYW
jgi:hypothetical protein